MDNSNNNPFLASNQFNQSGQTPANFGANNPSGSNPFAQANPVSSMNNSTPANPVTSEAPVTSANPVASEAPATSANSGDLSKSIHSWHASREPFEQKLCRYDWRRT